MTALNLATATPNVDLSKHPTRPGISLRMGHTGHRVSPEWLMGGWRLQFVRLGGGEKLLLDRTHGEVYVKVISGALTDPELHAYPPVGAVVTTKFDGETVTAGASGALISIFVRTPVAPEPLRSMEQLMVAGPLAESLEWQSFAARYGRVTPFFDGADAHLVPGFHLLDDDGMEIAYVFFWTAGKGVDLSTHNHGNTPSETAPAFAEVHQVLNNGTGHGGMYRTSAPGAADRARLPMQRGEEHGPFFEIDMATHKAKLRENGAVEYPWHGWQAGTDHRPGQSYDLVCAYEITAHYAVV